MVNVLILPKSKEALADWKDARSTVIIIIDFNSQAPTLFHAAVVQGMAMQV